MISTLPFWQHALWALGAFLGMEGVAYASHRWIMHGPMWIWHESHHRPRHGSLERNDGFGAVFSLIAMGLFALGLVGENPWPPAFGLGLGMTLYGAAYLFMHDILVHRRFGVNLHPKSRYLRSVLRSHRIHHARRTRQGCSDFGFLIPGPGKTLRISSRKKEVSTLS